MKLIAPLVLADQPIRPAWLDYNGHLRDAYFLLLFSLATDALMDHIGLDAQHREYSERTIYTLESQVRYLREVKGDAVVNVYTQIVAHDAKRLHVYQWMREEGSQPECATCEQMLLHVDTQGPRAAPFGPEVWPRVQALATAHAALPRPATLGRAIGLGGGSGAGAR